MNQYKHSMLEHYVGNGVLRIRLAFEEGNFEEVEEGRIRLIEKLRTIEDPRARKCIEYLGEKLMISEDLDDFVDKYEQLKRQT